MENDQLDQHEVNTTSQVSNFNYFTMENKIQSAQNQAPVQVVNRIFRQHAVFNLPSSLGPSDDNDLSGKQFLTFW